MTWPHCIRYIRFSLLINIYNYEALTARLLDPFLPYIAHNPAPIYLFGL